MDSGLEKLVKKKHFSYYMQLATATAGLSVAKRRRVGAVIVTQQRSLFIGYNGMPEGLDNDCEGSDGKTKPYVIHAEANALDKMAREGVSASESVCFTTCYPCVECAKRLTAVGVRWIVYKEDYSSDLAQALFDNFEVKVYRYQDLDLL